MKMKKGFTIVELLVVIGVLAVLMTIVVVAASGVQKGGREKRASAMRSALEQAIAAGKPHTTRRKASGRRRSRTRPRA